MRLDFKCMLRQTSLLLAAAFILSGCRCCGAPAPEAPVLISPQNGGPPVRSPRQLQWTVSEAVDQFILNLIQTSSNESCTEEIEFSGTNFSNDNIYTHTLNRCAVDPGSEYQWKVQSIKCNLKSEWSDQWLFTVQGVAVSPSLVSLDLILPQDGDTSVSIPVNFQWKTSVVDRFELELINTNTESTCIEDIPFSRPNFTPDTNIYDYQLNQCEVSLNYVYFWRVKAEKGGAVEWSDQWSFYAQIDYWPGTNDSDGDGIPNNIETEYGTSVDRKTLFIRPINKVVQQGELVDIFWDKFVELFPCPTSKPGFALIEPLDRANIEVVVIGRPSNLDENIDQWHDKAMFDNFDFPENNGAGKPCDILEVIHQIKYDGGEGFYYRGINQSYAAPREGESSVCAKGHIFVGSYTTIENNEDLIVNVWTWDIFGYTSWGAGGENFHGYYAPKIYPFPLSNYFYEGPYKSIQVGEYPITFNCGEYNITCDECSPMNLEDVAPGNAQSDLATQATTSTDTNSCPPDNTVEFNTVTYIKNSKAINSVVMSNDAFTEIEVLARTVAHEIGHAIIGPDESDINSGYVVDIYGHCSNPNCILYHKISDWDINIGFGESHRAGASVTTNGTNCAHSPGGYLDIRRPGFIHNTIH